MKARKRFIGLLTLSAVCGCEHNPSTPTTADRRSEKAVALLHPASQSQVSGTVTFYQEPGGVRVEATLNGLEPGEHGFHIHEKGDCSAPDASSAGGHFNPTGMPHGALDAPHRHLGDLGNLTAKADGSAAYSTLVTGLGFTGETSIIGRAVIVHARADDFKTQPTGDAGGRVACGVIEAK